MDHPRRLPLVQGDFQRPQDQIGLCWRRPIAQSTTRQLNASTVAARYSGRVLVGTSVMSETHSRFGAGRRYAFQMVVRNFRRCVTPV